MQYRFLCTKSRHTMINMSIFHACFKKYINFPVFWCIFGFAKIKLYAVRPPSILYIFSKFLSQKEIQLRIKMHLAFRVSSRMQNKRTFAQTGQRPCILHYTAQVFNVMRTCKGASVQVDQHVYFLLHLRRRRKGKGQRMF